MVDLKRVVSIGEQVPAWMIQGETHKWLGPWPVQVPITVEELAADIACVKYEHADISFLDGMYGLTQLNAELSCKTCMMIVGS